MEKNGPIEKTNRLDCLKTIFKQRKAVGLPRNKATCSGNLAFKNYTLSCGIKHKFKTRTTRYLAEKKQN